MVSATPVVVAEPGVSEPPPSTSRVGDEAVVVSATGVVSLVNYGYTLILLWLLPAREFAEVGSISALLLIGGTISGAALPWVLAQEVLRSRNDRSRRRIAVTFCLFATVLQGAAAGVATCLIAVHYASGPVLVAAFCSVVLIFVAATAAGYLQGLERFRLIAMVKVAEVVVKVGAGLGLVALGAGASGAIAGFALGAGVVAGVGLAYMAPNITWSRSAMAGRSLWASTQGLLAIQAGVAVLASMDVVIASLMLGATPELATYQAANIIGRVPVFIGAALSIVIFPRMIAARRPPREVIHNSISLYATLCVPITLIAATLPSPVVGLLFPARYGNVGAILPWAALAGLVMGVVNLTTTYFQAAGLFRRATSLLSLGVALCAGLDVFGLQLHAIMGLAVAVAAGAAVVAAALLWEIVRTWPGAIRGLARPVIIVILCCLPLVVLRSHVVVWALWAVACGVVFCLRGLLGISGGGDDRAAGERPRVLHLGYEDPRRPGAGGGSVRTHEINRRLTDSFDITVVCARYRGATTRTEDGVRYVHVGVASSDFPERLAYFVALPWALLRYRSDLVIEDFGAPFSSVAVPWMTGRPVIGMVQWLFASEKRRQYHLPFDWVEALGVRSHRRMIAVSDDLGGVLLARNPRAEVTVIANGLDAGAFERYDRERSDIVYLGRLEIAQKGLDLLIEAYARIADSIDQDLVLGGDGPDGEALLELADRLGVGDRVKFVGRVGTDERFAWLAGADLVAMPSRYETFGMVAAEALAVGTPVVAFDIPCLRALVDDKVGARVTAFDVPAFSEALRSLATDRDLRRRRGDAGPSRVASLNWDDLASHQAQVYGELLADPVPAGETDDGRGGMAASGRTRPGPSGGSGGGHDVAELPVRTGSVEGDGAWPERRPAVSVADESWVVGLLRAQCRRTPDRPAVTDGDVQWTYAELHQAAASVTRALSERGIGRGAAVGVCLPRSKEAIAAMIGIWAAGSVYVPFDPDHPEARLIEMARRAGVVLLIGGSRPPEGLARSVEFLDTRRIVPSGAASDSVESSEMDSSNHADSAAYILFTSGSSGRPKAVQVSHRSLNYVLRWIRSTFSPDEMAVTTTSISFSFDPFVFEVLGPLMMGGQVQVIPSALALSEAPLGPTFLASTPPVLTELLRANRLPPTLQAVMSGGEVLSGTLATALLQGTPVRRLINSYGPTEATVFATFLEVELPVEGAVPIGHDVPGARVLLLDPAGSLVAPGCTGEICIFGPQLADGYVGDPIGTAERFVEHPGPDGTVRIYRTGDLGRKGHGGVIEFLGRQDRQIKLRGYRIEPVEIEAALCRHPAVDAAVVSSVGTESEARLVAHVDCPSDGVTSADLREWLKRLLPGYMVPSHFVVMASFPVTAHGKLDVEHLPPWGPVPPVPGDRSPAGSEGCDDEVVEAVARLAAQAVGYDGPVSGFDDVLDDLGGSSLALFRLLTLIEEEFSCRLDISRVVEDTTVAGLAALVGVEPGAPRLLRVHDHGSKAPIFLIHTYLGTTLRYRRLGLHLSPDRPLVGLQVQGIDSPAQPTHTTVDQMAEEAVEQLRSVQPHGPYLIGGHSAGGLVAFEAARQLVRSGEDVPIVVLLDSPIVHSSPHYLWAEAVLNWPDIRSATPAQRRQQLSGLVTRRLSRIRRTPGPDRVGSAITRSYRANNLAVKHYRPGHYVGDVAVLSTRQGRIMALGQEDLGWGPMVDGRLSVIEIPGLHNTIFEAPQVEMVGRRIDTLLNEVEGVVDPRGVAAAPTR